MRVNLEDSILRNCVLVGRTVIQRGAVFVSDFGVPALLATAGAATYTIAQILTGLILRDPAGASRTDVLPTAALIMAALPDLKVGDTLAFTVTNAADAAETISISAGTGGTALTGVGADSVLIGRNSSKTIYIRMTAVGGTPTYDFYM